MNIHCSWDTTVISITIVSVLILLGAILMLAVKMRYYKRENRKFPVVFTGIGILVFTAVILGSALFVPINVSVDNEKLHIHRLKGDIVIPIEKIEEIRRADDSDTKNSTRTFGSGGAFGYLGKFRNANLGNYQMYVTNTSQGVIVKTNDETLVFSCDRPDEIINYIQTKR
jgi:hypothetical protein